MEAAFSRCCVAQGAASRYWWPPASGPGLAPVDLIVAFGDGVLDLLIQTVIRHRYPGVSVGEVSGNPCCLGRIRCWHGDSRRAGAAVAGLSRLAAVSQIPRGTADRSGGMDLSGQPAAQRPIMIVRFIGGSYDNCPLWRACPSRRPPNAGVPARSWKSTDGSFSLSSATSASTPNTRVGEHLVAGTIHGDQQWRCTICHGPNSAGGSATDFRTERARSG